MVSGYLPPSTRIPGISSLRMYKSGAVSAIAFSPQVVVVTDYAEGELFQILEDDGKLPEDQVCFLAQTSLCP